MPFPPTPPPTPTFMPNKTTRKGQKKRRYRKKRYYRKKKAIPLGLPMHQVARLRYADQISLDATAGSLTSYVFATNDCYDPDVTSTGHQPRYFDQYMTMFSKFVVLGSKITVKACCNSTASVDILLNLLTSTTVTAPTSVIQFLEERKRQYKILSPMTNEGLTLVSTYSGKKYNNKGWISDDTQAGSSSSGPIDKKYFILTAAAMNPTDNPPSVDFTVTIDYIVKFFDPIQPSQS